MAMNFYIVLFKGGERAHALKGYSSNSNYTHTHTLTLTSKLTITLSMSKYF